VKWKIQKNTPKPKNLKPTSLPLIPLSVYRERDEILIDDEVLEGNSLTERGGAPFYKIPSPTRGKSVK